LNNNSPYFTLAVPAREKLKKSVNFYCKKTSSSLILLRYFGMPSFYHLGSANG